MLRYDSNLPESRFTTHNLLKLFYQLFQKPISIHRFIKLQQIINPEIPCISTSLRPQTRNRIGYGGLYGVKGYGKQGNGKHH